MTATFGTSMAELTDDDVRAIKDIIELAEAMLVMLPPSYREEADIMRLIIRELNGAPQISLRKHYTQTPEDDPDAFSKINEGITGHAQMQKAGYTLDQHLEARGCKFMTMVHYVYSQTDICDIEEVEEQFSDGLTAVLMRMWLVHLVLVHGLCGHQATDKSLRELRIFHQLLLAH